MSSSESRPSAGRMTCLYSCAGTHEHKHARMGSGRVQPRRSAHRAHRLRVEQPLHAAEAVQRERARPDERLQVGDAHRAHFVHHLRARRAAVSPLSTGPAARARAACLGALVARHVRAIADGGALQQAQRQQRERAQAVGNILSPPVRVQDIGTRPQASCIHARAAHLAGAEDCATRAQHVGARGAHHLAGSAQRLGDRTIQRCTQA
jgi:hypothetical protein